MKCTPHIDVLRHLCLILIPKNTEKKPKKKKTKTVNVLLNTPKHIYDANINLFNLRTNIDLLFYQLL